MAARPRASTGAVTVVRLGVTVRAGVGVKLVGEGGVLLTDGSWMKAAAVLATTGQRPVAIPGLETLPHDRAGRLITDPTLQVAPGVWSGGSPARFVRLTGAGRAVWRRLVAGPVDSPAAATLENT